MVGRSKIGMRDHGDLWFDPKAPHLTRGEHGHFRQIVRGGLIGDMGIGQEKHAALQQH